MAELNADGTMTAHEAGKLGALRRWSPENRRLKRAQPEWEAKPELGPKIESLDGGKDEAGIGPEPGLRAGKGMTLGRLRKRVVKALEARLFGEGIVPFHGSQSLTGGDWESAEGYIAKYWPARLAREWEQLLDLCKAAKDWAMVRDILVAMTAMSPLSPGKVRQIASESLNLPSDADLSHLSDADIEQITQKKMLKVPQLIASRRPRPARKIAGGIPPKLKEMMADGAK